MVWHLAPPAPDGPWDEWYAFTLTENHRCTVTFRAVVSTGYAITNPVTIVVR